MTDCKVINLVSGKGGTGKTLFSAVLAEMLGANGYETLVVDLDAFVRGLTSLLYFHKQGALNLTEKDQFTVSDIFMSKGGEELDGKNISISRYLSFDVIPSVSRVDKILDFKDLMPDTKDEAYFILEKLLSSIPEKYDFIILDSRAGYDELISSTHRISDLSICIEEEDDISKITTENLIRQLQKDSDNPLFRVVNKARSAKTLEDLTSTASITELGRIPFDMDIMKGFGGPRFWEETERSLYKAALGHVWNSLCQKLAIKKEVRVSRISPFGNEAAESRLQMLSLKDRVIFFYGLVIGAVGLASGFLGSERIYYMLKDPVEFASIIMGFAGITMSIWVVVKGKSR